VEDEGRCIGSACIPQAFFDQMQAAPLYFVAVPKRDRIANLLRQYGAFPPAALIERLGKIQRRLGSHVYHKIVADIQEGAYDQAAAKVLWYYDKAYAGQLAARAPGKVYFLRPGQSSPEQKLTRLNTRASAPAAFPGPPSVDLAKL
jgi:tRNA 2-selenouridine synthase